MRKVQAMKQYSYSFDEEHYHGVYSSIEDAIDAVIDEPDLGRSFWIGECVPPPPPEQFWFATDWLERVVDQDEYSGEWADPWHDKIARSPALQGLEAQVRHVIGEWLSQNGLRPKFWNIDHACHYVIVDGKPEEVTP